MEVFSRGRVDGHRWWSCEDCLGLGFVIGLWFCCVCGWSSGRGNGVDFKHGDIDIIPPLATYPTGVNSSSQRIRIISINIRTPHGTSRAHLFALGFREVEAWDADCEGAVLLAFTAGNDEGCCCVGEFGVGSCGGGGWFEWRIVENGAEVAAGEVADEVEGVVVSDGGGWEAGGFVAGGCCGFGGGGVVVDCSVCTVVVV